VKNEDITLITETIYLVLGTLSPIEYGHSFLPLYKFELITGVLLHRMGHE
jgi:hypothetical protein